MEVCWLSRQPPALGLRAPLTAPHLRPSSGPQSSQPVSPCRLCRWGETSVQWLSPPSGMHAVKLSGGSLNPPSLWLEMKRGHPSLSLGSAHLPKSPTLTSTPDSWVLSVRWGSQHVNSAAHDRGQGWKKSCLRTHQPLLPGAQSTSVRWMKANCSWRVTSTHCKEIGHLGKGLHSSSGVCVLGWPLALGPGDRALGAEYREGLSVTTQSRTSG